MPRKSQRNRKRYQMQSPLFRAALHYKFRARRARQAGARPLTDDAARAAAAELLQAAAQWRQEWSAWRIQVERPPPVSSDPLPPPATRHGAVIRSAKSLGYAYQIKARTGLPWPWRSWKQPRPCRTSAGQQSRPRPRPRRQQRRSRLLMNPWSGPTALSRSKADPPRQGGRGSTSSSRTYYARPTGPPEGETL